MSQLDQYLGIHPAALQFRSQRTELIANNLANADTPNFKARDMDFRRALADVATKTADGGKTLALQTTRPGHIPLGESGGVSGGQQLYRVPLAPSLDGNTVDPQLEQAAFAENAVRYQSTLTFLGSKFRNMLTAITGQ
jgi:flagellar basal-body rod protein FlgB